ncbi:hypothetical protein ONZ43_g1566 [Nemania bipapillata]|uniref:Uncharacterized protein n=1 Tax=Nemania bipapillata TaxID=110536 RepID=A0ACC2J4B7_9PEZI|nr:hypothetical protein ONZ43_g1566 [Nemania bipapillata]
MGADCCGNKKTVAQSPGRAQDSCSSLSVTEDSKSLDCCTPGNEKCNEECLKSVAATLCAEGVGAHTDDYDDCCTKGCCDKSEPSACDAHLQMAFAQYQSFLDNVRCICRSMIDRGFKSCCKSSEAGARAGLKGGGKAPETYQHSKEQLDDCCTRNEQPNTCCGSKALSEEILVKKKPDNCCGDKQKPRGGCGSKDRTNDCCSDNNASSCSNGNDQPTSCLDECCGGKPKHTPDPCCNIEKQCQLVISHVGGKSESRDVEKGSGEEVRVSVNGMTCNGCSENLERNLAANGAYNIRINYLQGHADFAFDPALDLDAILAKTREATGFQITLMGGNESITVLTSGPRASKTLSSMNLDGVEEVVILNKKTVRLQYNPNAIGARELFNKIKYLSIGLAPPQHDQQLASGRKRFLVLFGQTIASFVLTIPILVLAWGNVHVDKDTKMITSLVLGSLVQLLAVPVFYKPALQSLLRYGVLELDMLVVIAITAAFVYSVVAFGYFMSGAPLETAAFFETSSLLISLIMLGRLVASYARIRAVASVSVRSLQASTAILVENGVDREIDSRLLQFGDVFKVMPHSRVPTDGIIASGVSEVDESMVTGESLPITKAPGASLIAGTTNGSGPLVVQLTRLPGKNTITDIAKLVEDASSSKPRVQEIADKVASWFLPTVLTIAAVVFIIWIVVGIKLLSSPMESLHEGGVIVKSARCTLTEPDLDVVSEEFFNNDAANARSITKSLISDSQHPVSVAVMKHLGTGTKASPLVTNIQSIPGDGIEGSMSGLKVRAGHASWTQTETLPEVRKMLDNSMSILMVTRDSTPIACYGLQTRLRADAIATIAKLRDDGISVHLVSGDQNKAVQAIAAVVGIDRANVASQRKPKEKQVYVATLMAQPGKVVMFCGDGTNDAVAVAQADIGVQLSDTISSEVTRSAADVVLLSGLSGIPFLIEVSRAAFLRIQLNFIWSAIYNFFAILLAAGAFVTARIAPAYAGAGELVSILPVIFIALTMLLLKLRPN